MGHHCLWLRILDAHPWRAEKHMTGRNKHNAGITLRYQSQALHTTAVVNSRCFSCWRLSIDVIVVSYRCMVWAVILWLTALKCCNWRCVYIVGMSEAAVDACIIRYVSATVGTSDYALVYPDVPASVVRCYRCLKNENTLRCTSSTVDWLALILSTRPTNVSWSPTLAAVHCFLPTDLCLW